VSTKTALKNAAALESAFQVDWARLVSLCSALKLRLRGKGAPYGSVAFARETLESSTLIPEVEGIASLAPPRGQNGSWFQTVETLDELIQWAIDREEPFLTDYGQVELDIGTGQFYVVTTAGMALANTRPQPFYAAVHTDLGSCIAFVRGPSQLAAQFRSCLHWLSVQTVLVGHLWLDPFVVPRSCPIPAAYREVFFTFAIDLGFVTPITHGDEFKEPVYGVLQHWVGEFLWALNSPNYVPKGKGVEQATLYDLLYYAFERFEFYRSYRAKRGGHFDGEAGKLLSLDRAVYLEALEWFLSCDLIVENHFDDLSGGEPQLLRDEDARKRLVEDLTEAGVLYRVNSKKAWPRCVNKTKIQDVLKGTTTLGRAVQLAQKWEHRLWKPPTSKYSEERMWTQSYGPRHLQQIVVDSHQVAPRTTGGRVILHIDRPSQETLRDGVRREILKLYQDLRVDDTFWEEVAQLLVECGWGEQRRDRFFLRPSGGMKKLLTRTQKAEHKAAEGSPPDCVAKTSDWPARFEATQARAEELFTFAWGAIREAAEADERNPIAALADVEFVGEQVWLVCADQEPEHWDPDATEEQIAQALAALADAAPDVIVWEEDVPYDDEEDRPIESSGVVTFEEDAVGLAIDMALDN